ncbi:MAG TPA: glycosyltransferase family 4 protein [Thermoplasmata archaeon]|nr:glycosyltransferase family 4 protein [Thermoplasmata archaeon]
MGGYSDRENRADWVVVHTALGRIGGAERQLLRFVQAARDHGERIDLYYAGPPFPELEAMGNLYTGPKSGDLAGTIRAYWSTLRELRRYRSILIYHHVEPVLLGLITALYGERCVVYLGEPLRPLWEEYVSGDGSLVSFPEMRKTVEQLYGHRASFLVNQPAVMWLLVRVLRQWDRMSIRRAGILLGNSVFTSRVLQRVYRLTEPPGVVYQGLPETPETPVEAPSSPTVLAVGAFIPHKDQETLLRAWTIVESRPEFPDARLVLVGNGPTRAACEELSRNLGLRRVRFEPAISEIALANLYEQASVLVHPAIAEPFGMAPLEAARHRVPSIVADSGGITEFVRNGENGRIFPPRDATTLADLISSMLANHPERVRMGFEAYRKQRTLFTIERTALQLLGFAGARLLPRSKDRSLPSPL